MKLKNLSVRLHRLGCHSRCWPPRAMPRQRRSTARAQCPADAPFLSADALKKAGFELTVFKRYCYADKSGSYALLLSEKQDLPFPKEPLSSAIQAVRSTRWEATTR
jgi:hypothetical protein